ncbi:hypothetical protein I5E68_16585 [Novosphingobium sp. YJ-S2-02]|uniref:EamA domain-containing protein n=1 Tax=Novosphingobium aureum TaxID=2792964 RepID=A0A931MMW2_9SPHN|nr:EamA family transporter [Novosphingobium aureum]MBH0114566.1 hypothetical protein [Novosphingobium aureum]
MTAGEVAGLLGFSAMLAAGQALFKTCALAVSRQSVSGNEGGKGTGLDFLALLQVPSFWAALMLYGLATVLWIYLLQTIPLSRAYPFAALGFVIVPAIAAVFFKESISASYVLGALLIVGGVIVTSRA